VEEEEYATRYIHYFSSGLLTLPEGTTLRASLADKLHCDPMRITKKYAGASCLGSKISRSLVGVVGEKNNGRPYYTAEEVECAKMELRQLDARFQMRLLGSSSGSGNGSSSHGGAPISPSNGGGNNNNNNEYGSSAVPPTPQTSMFDLSTYAGLRLAASNSGVSPSNSTRGSKMMMMSNATFPMSSTTTTTTPTPQSLLASSYLATLAGNASLAGGNNDQGLTSSTTSGGNNLNATTSILNTNHLPQQQPTMMMQGMNCGGQAGTSVNNVTTAR
jgi:hypothetical protein